MKAILMSIQRPHTDNIKALIKTIELRKSEPHLLTPPFSCYIYETKSKGGCGKVIGEFVCDRMYFWQDYWVNDEDYIHICKLSKLSCVSDYDIIKYCNKNYRCYAWHISQLKIYDKPKALSEFYTISANGSDCYCGCEHHECPLDEEPCKSCTGERKYLTRPPQSYMYCELLEEKYEIR